MAASSPVLFPLEEYLRTYLGMGMPTVWLVDPRRHRAYSAIEDGVLQPARTELAVEGTEIRVPVADIFAELDEMDALTQG